MKKQAGFIEQQTVLVLIGSLSTVIVSALLTLWSLVYWQVGQH